MRQLLSVAALALALPAAAGDIDMNLTNPEAVKPPAQRSSAPKAASGSAIKTLDAWLTQAAGGVKELEETLVSAQATLKSASAANTLDYQSAYLKKVEADCRATFRAGDVAAAAADVRLRGPIARYLTCQAVTTNQPAACSASPAYSKPPSHDATETMARNCVDAFYAVRFVEAKTTGGDAAAVCVKANAIQGHKGDAAGPCAKLAAGDCSVIRGLAWHPFGEEGECGAVFDAVAGKPGACAKNKPEDFGYTCADAAAVRAARKGGACGGSALCAGAVTGKLESCLPLLEPIAKSHCDFMAKNKAKAEQALIAAAALEWSKKNPHPRTAAMAQVVEKRKAVDAMLVGIGESIETFEPKTDPAFPARVSRYKELRRQADGALKRFKLATEGADKSKAPAAKTAP